MEKKILNLIFEKSSINGLIEKTKIEIKDGKITIPLLNDDKDLSGIITYQGIDLEDCEIGLYNLSQLLKLINVTEDDVSIKLEKKGSIYNKLLLKDKTYKLEYALADCNLISDVPEIEDFPFDYVLDIDLNFINTLIKGKKALPTDVNNIIIQGVVDVEKGPQIKLILGGSNNYSNKVIFSYPCSELRGNTSSSEFPLIKFKEILEVNKDLKKGKMSVISEGFVQLEFENENNIKSTYYLIGKAE